MIIHHIGIIVKNVYKAIELYERIGYKLVQGVFLDTVQNNQVAFLESSSLVKIELISAIDNTSSIYNFKEGYHHICYEAEFNEDIIKKFKEAKIGKIFTTPIVASAIDNRKVVFACLQNGTFIELII